VREYLPDGLDFFVLEGEEDECVAVDGTCSRANLCCPREFGCPCESDELVVGDWWDDTGEGNVAVGSDAALDFALRFVDSMAISCADLAAGVAGFHILP